MKLSVLAWCVLLPALIHCQSSDAKLDSLKRPLPKDATARRQAERLQGIMWHVFRTEESSYENFPQQLDSLLQCCLTAGTSDQKFVDRAEADMNLFKGIAILYEQPESAKPLIETSIRQYAALSDSGSMALGYLQLCIVASGVGDSLAFAQNHEVANRLAVHLKDPFLVALFHCNIGIVCYDFGRYADAASHYFESLALIEKYKTPEMLDGKRDVYHNIAGVYERLGDTDNAMQYVQKAIESAIETQQNPSDHMGMLGWIHLERKEYRQALEAFQRIEVNETNETMGRIAEKTYGLATCYRNLGDVKTALPLARKAVELLPVSSNVHYGAAALHELAACEFASGLTGQALRHSLAAFQAFTNGKNNRGSAEEAALLSEIYKSRSDFRKALEYSELRFQFQQKVERQQSTRQLAFGEFTRENKVKTARREAEVQAQLTRQRNIRYALFAGLAMLALLAFLFYNRYRLKRRSAELLAAKNREVEAARAQAERSEAFKSRFLANMSHEIRTPLHGISGYTELLLEGSLTEKQRRYLASIQHSSERLTEVVNDILDISKLEAGEVRLRQAPFSPARIADDVREAFSVRAEHKGVALGVHLGAGVPDAVLGDPTRLYQILMNLVGNALKFTEKGTVQLTITGQPLAEEGQPAKTTLFYSIADTGIGIPAEKLETIFNSFQQADNDTSARFGGTGLGLTIARELVQLHGSDIQVQSIPGQGSVFSFAISLPLADAADLETTSDASADLYFTQPLKILLADDNAFNREIASEALLRHFEQVEIVEAANGREVLDLLEQDFTAPQRPFDLVLMDMQMPEMNGTETTRFIRQHFPVGKNDVPIIALTASATPDEIEAALASGMNRHLGKPFKTHELASVVADTLGLQENAATFKGTAAVHSVLSPAPAQHVDLAYLRDFCDGDEVQMQHFIQRFEEECRLAMQKLEQAVGAEDREAVYRVAHSFKPQCTFVGLNNAAELAAALEQGAREGLDFDGINALVRQLSQVIKMQ